jgi:hypothetical protein
MLTHLNHTYLIGYCRNRLDRADGALALLVGSSDQSVGEDNVLVEATGETARLLRAHAQRGVLLALECHIEAPSTVRVDRVLSITRPKETDRAT